MTAPRHHAINYVELTAPDFAAVKAFYGSVFGWTFTDWGDDYISFDPEEAGIDGGFAKGEAGQRGGALLVIHSDDLEGTREAVLAAGGAITVDIFSFPGGRRFQFRDTSGNELSAWTATAE